MYKVNSKKIVDSYLKKLSFKKKYKYKLRACEICGSKKNTVLQKQISMGNNKFVEFPIVTCDVCGFVYQAIKFSKDFYKDFYGRFYRQNIYSDLKPSNGFINRQKIRSKYFHKFIKSNFKLKKKDPCLMLDVLSVSF